MADVVADRARPKSAARRNASRTGSRAFLLFLVPAAVFYGFVVLIPSMQGVVLSFTNWDGIRSDWSFVGIDNFLRLFGDAVSVKAIGNTFVYAIISTVFENILGLLITAGADVSAGDENNTALHGAVAFEQVETVRWLLANDANPYARDHEGRLPIDLAAEKGNAELIALLEPYTDEDGPGE